MNKCILIADDDSSIRTVLRYALQDMDADVKITASAKKLTDWIDEGLGDCVLTDVSMEDGNGIDVLRHSRKVRPNLPVVIMSAQNTVLTAINASEYGAFEYLPKPFDLNEVKSVLTTAMYDSGNGKPQDSTVEKLPIIGKSFKMQDVYRSIGRLVKSDETVLINGESGTGKELVAKTLHDFGLRKGKPFIAINMGAIPKDLIESELFGYEKGAFTGADTSREGKFLQADGGTLFLDEIGDMPVEAQTRLLRVLQEGEISPIGSSKIYKCNVRIISATHQSLEQMLTSGRFRQDLFYRLNVLPIDLPPLRERLDDIGDLVEHFLNIYKIHNLETKFFTADAIEALKTHDWAGNVRELENFIRRACILIAGATVTDKTVYSMLNKDCKSTNDIGVVNVSDITAGNNLQNIIGGYIKSFYDEHSTPTDVYNKFLQQLELPLIQHTLNYCNGNQIKASYILGLNRNTLRKKIKNLNIEIIKNNKE